MQNGRSVGAESNAQKKMTAITGGGKGRTIPVTTACISRSWKVEVCQKKNYILRSIYYILWKLKYTPAVRSNIHVSLEKINQQSATIRSTSSTKQNKLICQLRTNTRLLAPDRQTTTATHPGTTATTKHAVLLSTYHHLRVAQLNNRRRNLYNTTLEAPGTQPLAMLLCGFSWRSNRSHYYLLLV